MCLRVGVDKHMRLKAAFFLPELASSRHLRVLAPLRKFLIPFTDATIGSLGVLLLLLALIKKIPEPTIIVATTTPLIIFVFFVIGHSTHMMWLVSKPIAQNRRRTCRYKVASP